MHTRPAAMSDLPAIAELHARSDVFWFGAPELSADEIAERLRTIESFARDSLLVLDGARLLAVALRWQHDTWLTVDPDAPAERFYEKVFSWFSAREPRTVEALSSDHVRRLTLESAGWRHVHSAFDLHRAVSPDLTLDAPQWPAGITLRDYSPGDDLAIHRLIYVDAAWADVPGHPYRDLADWRRIFVTTETVAEAQHLAWRGERLVGVAMGRTWDDGTGWVSQLAVSQAERGKGLGRALLLASLRARVEGGARAVGLSVQAANRRAIALYLGVGLRIEREYLTYAAG